MKSRHPDSAMGGFTRLLHRCPANTHVLRGSSGASKQCAKKPVCLFAVSRVSFCSGKSDYLMDEIPTVVVDPLPAGVDQVKIFENSLVLSHVLR